MRGCIALVPLLLSVACDSAAIGEPELVTAAPTLGALYEGEAPDSALVEEQQGLIDVVPLAQGWFTVAGQAYGRGYSTGFGNHAKQELTLQLYQGVTEVGQPTSSEETWQVFLPRIFSLVDTVMKNTSAQCGVNSTVTVRSEASLFALANWQTIRLGHRSRHTTGNGYQNPCPPPPDCDDPLTEQVEECPPIAPGGGPISQSLPTLRPTPMGEEVWYCESIDWFASWDGGQTWYYTGTTITDNCWPEMQ